MTCVEVKTRPVSDPPWNVTPVKRGLLLLPRVPRSKSNRLHMLEHPNLSFGIRCTGRHWTHYLMQSQRCPWHYWIIENRTELNHIVHI